MLRKIPWVIITAHVLTASYSGSVFGADHFLRVRRILCHFNSQIAFRRALDSTGECPNYMCESTGMPGSSSLCSGMLWTMLEETSLSRRPQGVCDRFLGAHRGAQAEIKRTLNHVLFSLIWRFHLAKAKWLAGTSTLPATPGRHPTRTIGIFRFSSGIISACVVATYPTHHRLFVMQEAYRLAFWIGFRSQLYRVSVPIVSHVQVHE